MYITRNKIIFGRKLDFNIFCHHLKVTNSNWIKKEYLSLNK